MIPTISRRWTFLLFCLLISSGCSAGLPQAPTDQLIKGPFFITTKWQTIKFDKPLKTLPHIQRFEILLNMNRYEAVNDIGQSEYDVIGDSYLSTENNIPLRPEVIFIDNKNYEYRATKKAVGFDKVESKEYHFLAYGTNANKGEFYFSEKIEFVAVKIKANIDFKVEGFFWYSPTYYRKPKKTWNDATPSKIVKFD